MKLKNKSIFILIVFSIITNWSYAQSGFIGKKHEASFDISSAIFGTIGGSYKYSYSKRSSMILDLGLISKSSDKLNSYSNLNTFVPAAKFNGLMMGIGILWNSKSAGMNMPIGYYTGFSIDYVKGKLTNTIPKHQLSETVEWTTYALNYNENHTAYYQTNTNDLDYTFNASGYHFNFYYGKNLYLAKNIVMDLCIKWGFAYYAYKPTNFTAYPVNTNNSYLSEPKHVGYANSGGYTIYDKSDDIYYIKNGGFNLLPNLYPSAIADQVNNSGSKATSSDLLLYGSSGIETAKTLRVFKFILLPQIKVGYLF
ncbi:MAG: hypothetical protein RL065_1982 [Bacteroidota bacterium]